jgi:hypothetical protein
MNNDKITKEFQTRTSYLLQIMLNYGLLKVIYYHLCNIIFTNFIAENAHIFLNLKKNF